MVGAPGAMLELSRLLLARIQSRATAEKAVISWVSVKMLEWCGARQIPPPAPLIELLRVHLKVDRFGGPGDQDAVARARAVEYLARNPEAKLLEVSAAVGASAVAVSKWRRQSWFKLALEQLRAASAVRAAVEEAAHMPPNDFVDEDEQDTGP
jgi:hypothetical protein